jgi:predicted XRE-type DNA-binding protein
MNPITKSSGNVFEDLLLPDAPGLMARAQLTREIAKVIERKKLNQVEAAQRLGIDQPKISALLRGRFEGFSVERLIRLLGALDQDVKIVVKPRRPASAAP